LKKFGERSLLFNYSNAFFKKQTNITNVLVNSRVTVRNTKKTVNGFGLAFNTIYAKPFFVLHTVSTFNKNDRFLLNYSN